MLIRKFEFEKDISFIKESIKSQEYTQYIRENTTDKDFENTEILIVEINDEKYGFIELKDIDILNKRITINIYMNKKNNMINSLAIFRVISILFKERKFHRISIKVQESNLNMRNILDKCGVFLEGSIINDNRIVYLYSILDYEYEKIKQRILGVET